MKNSHNQISILKGHGHRNNQYKICGTQKQAVLILKNRPPLDLLQSPILSHDPVTLCNRPNLSRAHRNKNSEINNIDSENQQQAPLDLLQSPILTHNSSHPMQPSTSLSRTQKQSIRNNQYWFWKVTGTETININSVKWI